MPPSFIFALRFILFFLYKFQNPFSGICLSSPLFPVTSEKVKYYKNICVIPEKYFKKLFSIYLTNIFSSSYFMFKSGVHLGVDYECNFIILQVSAQIFQQHLLNNLSVPHQCEISHFPHTSNLICIWYICCNSMLSH